MLVRQILYDANLVSSAAARVSNAGFWCGIRSTHGRGSRRISGDSANANAINRPVQRTCNAHSTTTSNALACDSTRYLDSNYADPIVRHTADQKIDEPR